MAKWEKHWDQFETVMKGRLDTGHKEYGDASFNRKPTDLATELEEEALDVVGWGFILWVRLTELRNKMDETQQLELPFDGEK